MASATWRSRHEEFLEITVTGRRWEVRLSDTGSATAAFTRQMLAQARQEYPLGPIIGRKPSGSTDAHLVRCILQQADNILKIEP